MILFIQQTERTNLMPQGHINRWPCLRPIVEAL